MSKAKQALIITLTERFPKAFPAKPKAVRPLKIGIDQDIHQACPELDEKLLGQVIGGHTRRLSYLKALVRGGQRIDLDGNPVEAISPEAIAQAQERLNSRLNPPSKGTEPKAQEKPVTAQSKPHKPVPPKAPEKPIATQSKPPKPEGKGTALNAQERPAKAPTKPHEPVPPKAPERSVTVQTKPRTPAIKATVATRSGLPILTLKGKR